MINNYFNLPGIPCKDREEIIKKSGVNINKTKCDGLNPNEIYKTLYPQDANPLGQFIQYNNVNIPETEETINAKDVKECSEKALRDKDDYFVYNKKANQCLFYNQNEVSKKEFNLEGYDLETYRKNNLIVKSGCNSSDNFISMPKGFYPDVNKISSYTKKISDENLSKEECFTTCANDKNCESFIFANGKKSCSFGKGIPDVNNAKNSKVGYNTFVKNNNLPKPIIQPNEDLSEYYRKYNKKGKIGDYFCAYSEGEDKCLTSYRVGPKGKEVPKKDNIKKTKDIPKQSLCLPPYCIPKKTKGNLKGKLRVNNEVQLMCEPGDTKCENNIFSKGLNYQDELGLPSIYSSSNPSNGYPYYENNFKGYQNLVPQTNILTDAPGVDAFEFKEGCMKWCQDEQNCGGISYKHGMDGGAKCKYYSNEGEQLIRDSLSYDKGTNTQIKTQNPYEKNPPKALEKKPYFNNQEVPFDLPTQNICEGFSMNFNKDKDKLKNISKTNLDKDKLKNAAKTNLDTDKLKNLSKNNFKTPFGTTPLFNVKQNYFSGLYIYYVIPNDIKDMNIYILSRNCTESPPCQTLTLEGETFFVLYNELKDKNNEEKQKQIKSIDEGLNNGTISFFYCNKKFENCDNLGFGINACKYKNNFYVSSLSPWLFIDFTTKKPLIPKKSDCLYLDNIWYYKVPENTANSIEESEKKNPDTCKLNPDAFHPNNPYEQSYIKYQIPFSELKPEGCCFSFTQQTLKKYSQKTNHNDYWNKSFNDVKGTFCVDNNKCSEMGISNASTLWNDNVDKIAIVSLVKNKRSEKPFAKDKFNRNVYLIDIVTESTFPKLDSNSIKRPTPTTQPPIAETKPIKIKQISTDTRVLAVENSIDTENYGMCPFGNIPKTDLAGSNCPMVEGFNLNCKNSTYGCCSDEETAKINNQGTNCPVINRDVCLKSQYGCCPGTIIPKKLLCDCIEDDTTKPVGTDCSNTNCGSARICLNNKCFKTPGCDSEFCKTNKKLFNCELNENQVGDPYAFSLGIGNKCQNNNQCAEGQYCVDGLCRKYNKDFVNTINNVEKGTYTKNSGQQFGEYMDTVASCGCLNRDFVPSEECENEYEPVCGMNNKTYQNACHLSREGQTIKHFGSCNQTIETFSNKKSCLIWLFIFILFIILVFGFSFLS